MATRVQPSRAELLIHDAELQSLALEHSRYEAQLSDLSNTPYVSSEALLLEADLKKKKLKVKDQMAKRMALLSSCIEVH